MSFGLSKTEFLNLKFPYLHIIALGIIYLAFPTQNANIDSWFYAASVRHQQELFYSHHLLYNSIGSAWHRLLQLAIPHIEAIHSLQLMNAVAATLCLLVFRSILLRIGTEHRQTIWLTVLCGVSFGVIRYATDAETYILPLLFSLLSTYYFIKQSSIANLLWSSLFAVMAILIHQLHLWWAIAMVLTLMFRKPFNLKAFILFSCPFVLVPLVYYMAFRQLDFPGDFWQFLTGEYSKGNASIHASLKGLGLTLVNFLRSFIQIHGQIFYLAGRYAIASLTVLLLLVGIILYAYKNRGFNPRLVKLEYKKPYRNLFILAFLFHFGFAFLSSGNAEFMVMLPFLTVLILVSTYRIQSLLAIQVLCLLMFVWNMSTAIVPSRFCHLNNVDKQVDFTLKHPDNYFLWQHKPLIENIITYKIGFGHTYKFIRFDDKTQVFMDSLIIQGIPVYTDFTNPGTKFSREQIMNAPNNIQGRYLFEPQDTWQNIYGENHIYLILKKGD
jgi:hypothetical protein